MSSSKSVPDKPSSITSFFRYNIAAIVATSADFFTLILLTEIFNLWYVLSVIVGAIIGATIAFTLGRYWAFVSTVERKRTQALKYVIVAVGSVLLNSVGVYLLTDHIEIQYIISKIIVATLVALAYNYPLSKYYTFKQ